VVGEGGYEKEGWGGWQRWGGGDGRGGGERVKGNEGGGLGREGRG